MRGIFLLVVLVGLVGASFAAPYVALMLWGWLSLMAPQRITFGVFYSLPLNQVVAILTIGLWLFARESKRLPDNPISWLLVIFFVWLCVSQVFSLRPEVSYGNFVQFLKSLLFIFLCLSMMTSRIRIHAMVWIFTISIGYFGVRNGFVTIIGGGRHNVFGPSGTVIADNNHLGLALVCVLPFMIYLIQQSEHRLIRRGLMGALALNTIAILGTQSRGALVALSAFGAYWWWQSKRKVLIAGVIVAAAMATMSVMPDTWLSRMESIQNYSSDGSFQGRVVNWKVNWGFAVDNPLTGAGLRVPYMDEEADRYLTESRRARAAHSIYFEILGGMGFVGLFIYLLLILSGWRVAGQVRAASKNSGELQWMFDLSTATQISLLCFAIGGLGVSMEMWEGYLLVIAFSATLMELSTRQIALAAEDTKFGTTAGR